MTDLTQSIIDFVRRSHEGQLDAGGNPYFNHVSFVGNRLKIFGEQPYVYHAGYCHDLLEDTDTTPEELLSVVRDPRTVEIVQLVSRKKETPYLEFIHSIGKSKNYGAIQVKLVDLFHNSLPSRISQLPEEKRTIIDRYIKATNILNSYLAGARE